MSCERCGYKGCTSSHTCPNCSKPIKYGLSQEEFRTHGEAGEALGEGCFLVMAKIFPVVIKYWSIFVLMFFSGWFIPVQVRKYFGLSIEDDYFNYMGVVSLLVVIVILIFRKRLAGLIGQLIAAILIAGAIWGPDVLTPEERGVKQARDEFQPLLWAALGVSCWERLEWLEEKEAIFEKDVMIEQCEASEARFLELAGNSTDNMVAKLCDPKFGGDARNSPAVDDFCKSRQL